jgi:hypothetical protein
LRTTNLFGVQIQNILVHPFRLAAYHVGAYKQILDKGIVGGQTKAKPPEVPQPTSASPARSTV